MSTRLSHETFCPATCRPQRLSPTSGLLEPAGALLKCCGAGSHQDCLIKAAIKERQRFRKI